MNTYEEYLSLEKALPVDQMETIHAAIIEESENDPDARELYEEFVSACIKYAAIRAEWGIMSKEEKMDKDPYRTSCHDMVILHANMLARYLRNIGKKVVWRDKLGNEEEDRIYRKVIGDFACYVAFITAINSR